MQNKLFLSIHFQIFISVVNPSGELLIKTWSHTGVFTALAAFNGLFTSNSKYAEFYTPVGGRRAGFQHLETQEIQFLIPFEGMIRYPVNMNTLCPRNLENMRILEESR